MFELLSILFARNDPLWGQIKNIFIDSELIEFFWNISFLFDILIDWVENINERVTYDEWTF